MLQQIQSGSKVYLRNNQPACLRNNQPVDVRPKEALWVNCEFLESQSNENNL
jgi:hypothetical protein